MAKQKHVVGQPVGFFLGQASRPPMGSGPMMSNPAPFSNPGGVGPFFSGGTPFQGVRPPFQGGGFFQGGPGGMPPMSPPGGSGGLGGLIQGLLGGNGGFNLPSILKKEHWEDGDVWVGNQLGTVPYSDGKPDNL